MESAMDQRIEAQIRDWRAYLLRRRSIDDVDVDELEDHLRSQMSELGAVGLSGDESFLVAIKRLGGVSELSREFARERSSRLWKQLVLGGHSKSRRTGLVPVEFVIMAGFAVAAALAFKLPAVFGINPFGNADGANEAEASFYARNAGVLVLPFLASFLAWERRLSIRAVLWLGVPFVAAALLVNVYPFDEGGDTELLTAIHLPIFLWLVAGVAYLGGAWRIGAPRMDFVRFTGEWVIYYALIALGGGVLTAMTAGIFQAIGIDAVPVISAWMLPCGAVGAVIVVAWLVEAKQSVIENMAPVLTSVFTPLFAAMLVAATVGLAVSGGAIDVERDVLILFDLLLVLVVGLVLYSVSAREADSTPSLMDAVLLVMVVSGLVIDVAALVEMLSRISELGFTPNRVAGLGLNAILLGNLLWSAWLLTGFLRGRRSFAELERWQTAYIPVYAGWALVVVVAFPPLFSFA
jgi:hypothetical protein